MGKQDIKNLQKKNKLLRQENKKLANEIARLNLLMNENFETIIYQKDSIENRNHEIEFLKNENLKLQNQINEFEKSNDQKSVTKKKSQNIAGWTVTKNQDGYFRAKRRIKGKTRSVYIGKRITGKTKNKIIAKEKEIRSKLEIEKPKS